MEGMKTSVGSSTPRMVAVEDGLEAQPQPGVRAQDELVRIEFYKTYDVMTGIRIAATLGGFFSMMILLVLYKNYCKPGKSLSEEQLNRAVSAAVEEEDRALAAALEATSFYSSLGKQRQSIGSGSQPRYSSPGAGGPTLRYSSEKDCDDDDMVSEEEVAIGEVDQSVPDYYSCSYLSVPFDRRASSITCSSGDSSYLERRGSTFEMGLPAIPSYKKKLPANEEPWDFYYPIDIQVIQPTPPDASPSTSELTLYEDPRKVAPGVHCLKVPAIQDRMQRLTVDRSQIGIAPLASISSLGSFSSQSSPWLSALRKEKRGAKEEHHDDSVGSDSVFDEDQDTEDEVEEFETDSELEDGFDDDYSFCEASMRPVSRCEKQPRFASFDSCDISLGEGTEEGGRPSTTRSPRHSARQQSVQDGVRTKKRLTKTYSEPRHKVLPPWVERGRSGFVPRRQLSAPSDRSEKESTPPAASERPPLPLPHSGSESDSITLTQRDDCLSQGNQTDVPISKFKRPRFVKQKTIHEGAASSSLLLPAMEISASCERLAEVTDTSIVINLEQASRSSSQETLC